MLHFIFPSDPLERKIIDSHFAPQATALNRYLSSFYSVETGRFWGDCTANGFDDAVVVYRGWMLDEAEYRTLANRVKKLGGRMFIDPVQYIRCHHLPCWYPLIAEFTPDTVVFPDFCFTPQFNLVLALQALGWEHYFIKDYVKSLKLENHPSVTTPQDVLTLLDAMTKFRGKLEGGICVRRVEKLTNEQRFFIVQGEVYGMGMAKDATVSDTLEAVRTRIASPFYSVDIALRDDGESRVVEIGDGQVSDLVGDWTPEAFANIWTGVYHD